MLRLSTSRPALRSLSSSKGRRALVAGVAVIMAGSGLTALAPAASASAPAAASAAASTPVYLDTSYTPVERAADLVSRLTTAEKAAQMDSSKPPAITRLGVAAWGWWNEANHGINAQTINATGNATTLTNTTSYPSDLSMGSTWNPDLVYAQAQQIGAEARDTAPGYAENLDFYAPTVNLSRDPRWGRNDESWGEDPTLVANLASQYVNGLQGQNEQGQLPASANGYYQAIATLKHYAANNSEVNRLTGNSVMTDKQLREYYTAQFAGIIAQSHPGSIMSSYNEINGTPAAASVQLTDTLARETFGFNGYFTSDCDAVYEEQAGHSWVPPNATSAVNQFTRAAYSITAGEDLDCNAGYSDGHGYGDSVPTALTQNIQTLTDTFNINDVDVSLVRLFTARIETGEFDDQSSVPWVTAARARLGGTTWVSNNSNNAITETPDRLAQAQASADQSIVLLHNDKPAGAPSSLLPLKVPSSGAYKVLVLGQYAHPSNLFLGGYSSIQGTAGTANNVDSYAGVKSAVTAIDPDAQVDYMKGFTDSGTNSSNCCTTVDPAAVTAAGGYDAVLVVVGTDSSTGREDVDRTNIALPGSQAALISQVEAVNPKTIVYMETMGLVDTSAFGNTTSALLWSSYNGQRQGLALADVLTGKVNPSGHLPFTWYTNQSDLPPTTDYNLTPTATTAGRTYMYFTGAVTWPFGYGLSYDTYSYANLRVSSSAADANDTLTISADVTNNGTTAGQTVPQLYVTTPFEPASAQDPAKRLEASDKVSLAAGATKTVTFSVPVSKLAYYDTTSNAYIVDPGTYGLQVSSSAADADVQLHATVDISGTLLEKPMTLTAKPIQTGDVAKDIAQRVMFDVNTTITPQLTVAMTDQKLYGYVTKGQSTALPAGAVVTYSSNRPAVVKVNTDQTLTTLAPGIATVTATLTYNGASASTSFVADVGVLSFVSAAAVTFTQSTPGTFTVTTSGSPTPVLTETGALPAGITFHDNGNGTATLAGTSNDAVGIYPITITAHNGLAADVTQNFTLTLAAPSACVTVATGQVLTDGNFEAATLGPWGGFGGAKVALTTADAATGQQSVVTTNRSGPYQGPSQSVANKVIVGGKYTISAAVKYTTGDPTHSFGITMTDGSHYANMVTTTVTQGQWTTISGTYTVPASGMDLTKASIYVETPASGGTTDVMSFWTDDVSMVGPTSVSTTFDGGLVTNGGFETGSILPWTSHGTAILAVDRTDAGDGSCSAAVSGRTTTDSGPAQSLANKLVVGTVYTVAAKVKYTTGPDTKTFDVALVDGAGHLAVMASAVATKGQWTTISGPFRVPASIDVTTARVLVDTPDAANPDPANDLMNFSVDSVAISAAPLPVITSVSVADGDVVKGTVTFQVNLAGVASDIAYTYIELNQNGTWLTDNTTPSAIALGSTNAGLTPKLVVDTTTLNNGTYGLKIDVVGTDGATTEKTISFTVDNPMAMPTLTSAIAPVNGWYSSPVSVALVSSVVGDKIQYQVDGGGWRNYANPFSISADGVHTVATRLLSNSVVVDTSDRTFTVKVDKTKPVASSAANPTSRSGSPRNPVTVVFTATDATSGVAKIEYNVNGGAWITVASGAPVTFATVGTSVIGYRATDVAGNVSAVKSYSVTISADPATAVKVSPTKAAAGTYVTVNVTGFDRYSMVDLSLGTTPLASVLTDVNGAAKVTVLVPAATTAGSYPVTATEQGSTLTSTTSIKITG